MILHKLQHARAAEPFQRFRFGRLFAQLNRKEGDNRTFGARLRKRLQVLRLDPTHTSCFGLVSSII